MQNNSITILLSNWQDKIPKDSYFPLQEQLEKTSENQLLLLSSIPLKSPIIGLLLGIFFGGFGVDRFYKGDIALGIAKLVTTVLLCISLIGYFFAWIWPLIDFFFVWQGIKKDNLAKIQDVLAQSQEQDQQS